MTEQNTLNLKSKAFRDGEQIRMLDFAIRGLPRHALQGEQYVDRDWALGIYQDEIRRLDALDIHSRWFTSGILGAALISVKLSPQTFELWRRLANHEVRRDERGSDAPCLLREIIERHQNDRRLTRSQDYQLFLFQAGLAMARAWTYHADSDHRYVSLPPIPDAAELIAEVRLLEGERHAKMRFRPPKITRERWVALSRPEIIHAPDYEQVLGLAERASRLEAQPLSTESLEKALNWVSDFPPPSKMAHPAALAAAVVSIAQAGECRHLWERVFGQLGRRCPVPGRKPVSDLSATVMDAIMLANRSSDPESAAAALYHRARFLSEQSLERPDAFRMSLPRVPRDRPVDAHWQDLNINFAPRVEFASERRAPTLNPEPDDSDDSEDGGVGSARRKSSSESVRKRLDTGRAGEEWFLQHYQTLCALFHGAPLYDCRERQSGYDCRLETREGDCYVELKTVRQCGGSVRLTDCQWSRASLEGEKYFLIVIRGIDGERPDALIIRNPAARLDPHRREVMVPRVEWYVPLADLEWAAARYPV
ncbi:MAG: DUF3883 domain-containing protein [Verrucomicrobia bacterium]|jgi:hypothetical protein|nr:DUF3883 domain-containing protein [Verrucomicrobiota bacterium]